VNTKVSKTNVSSAFFSDRLDEVRISSHERIKAKAQLQRAEAVADAIAGGIHLIKRAFRALTARPYRRPTHSAG